VLLEAPHAPLLHAAVHQALVPLSMVPSMQAADWAEHKVLCRTIKNVFQQEYGNDKQSRRLFAFKAFMQPTLQVRISRYSVTPACYCRHAPSNVLSK
jgi:hypothetical protein